MSKFAVNRCYKINEDDYRRLAEERGYIWVGTPGGKLPERTSRSTGWDIKALPGTKSQPMLITSYNLIKKKEMLPPAVYSRSLTEADYHALAVEHQCEWKGDKLPAFNKDITSWERNGFTEEKSYKNLKEFGWQKTSHGNEARDEYHQVASSNGGKWIGFRYMLLIDW